MPLTFSYLFKSPTSTIIKIQIFTFMSSRTAAVLLGLIVTFFPSTGLTTGLPAGRNLQQESSSTTLPIRPFEKPVKCPSIAFFTNQSTNTKRYLIPNTSQMCKYLTKSCCTLQEFDQIRSWWESPLYSDQRSRFQTKKERLTQIAVFTTDLISQKEKLTYYARQIQSAPKKFEGYCSDQSKKFLAFSFSPEKEDIWNEVRDFTNEYLRDTQQCWSSLNNIQNGILCSACDPRSQRILNFMKGEFIFGANTIQKISDNCKNLLWTMSRRILPYLRAVNDLVRCDLTTGQLNSQIPLYDYYASAPNQSFSAEEVTEAKSEFEIEGRMVQD